MEEILSLQHARVRLNILRIFLFFKTYFIKLSRSYDFVSNEDFRDGFETSERDGIYR